MRTTVIHLPPEVLGRVCFFLEGAASLRLLKTHPLFSKLLLRTGGLQDFFMTETSVGYLRLKSLTLKTSHFSVLLSLRLIFPKSNLIIVPSQLPHLPPTLKTLHLQYRQALESWHSISLDDHIPPVSLSMNDILPRLESLILIGEKWNHLSMEYYDMKHAWTMEMHQNFLWNLSLGLRQLHLSHYPAIQKPKYLFRLLALETLIGSSDTVDVGSELPDWLLTFHPSAIAQFNSQHLSSWLPPKLTSLDVPFYPSWVRSTGPVAEKTFFAALPRSLLSLVIRHVSSTFPGWESLALAPSLTSFIATNTSSFQYSYIELLPRSLLKLVIDPCGVNSSSSHIPAEIIPRLPPNLTLLHFCKHGQFMLPDHLALLPKSITDLHIGIFPSETIFEGLPPKITTFSCWASNNGPIHASVLKHLPASITRLSTFDFIGITDESMLDLPPNLVFYCTNAESFTDACIDLMPSSILEFNVHSLIVTGIYESNDLDLSPTSFETSFASFWRSRFPSSDLPHRKLFILHLPIECKTLTLKQHIPLAANAILKCPHLSLIDVGDLVCATNKPLEGAHHINFDTAITGLKHLNEPFPDSLTSISLSHDTLWSSTNLHLLPRYLRVFSSPSNDRILPTIALPSTLQVLNLRRCHWDDFAIHDQHDGAILPFVPLPPSLTSLTVHSIGKTVVKMLPMGLLTLNASIESLDLLSCFSCLPAGLQSLDLHHLILSDSNFSNELVLALPRTLTHFKGEKTSFDATSISSLPSTLQKIFCRSIILNSLSWISSIIDSNIKRIFIPDDIMENAFKRNLGDTEIKTLFSCAFPPQDLAFLPKTIKSLTIRRAFHTETSIISAFDEEWFGKQMEELKFDNTWIPDMALLSLPPSITRLHLQGLGPDPSKDKLTTDAYTMMPQKLESLIIDNAPQITDETARMLPITLKTLRLTKCEVSPDIIPLLPRSITSLQLPNADLDESTIKHLPPGIKDLEIEHPSRAMRIYIANLSVKDFMEI
jgi:hypothetical protein